jgi:hypothetical protein
MKSFFTSLFLFFCFSFFAQKTTKVDNIAGSSAVAGDVSPNTARIQALNNAKINALKAAGIDEHINSYQILFSSQLKNDYTQFFSSDIQSEIQGAVRSYKINSEKLYCKSAGEISYDVNIDATVVKYDTRPDPAFTANIGGVKGVYGNGDNLAFNLKATKDCWLTIFNITDKEALLLYPNDYEKQSELKKLENYSFPTAKIDYTLGNETKKDETNRLIFVFTKEFIPYIKTNKQVTSHEDIFSWIYSIPPDKRKVEYFTLSISTQPSQK